MNWSCEPLKLNVSKYPVTADMPAQRFEPEPKPYALSLVGFTLPFMYIVTAAPEAPPMYSVLEEFNHEPLIQKLFADACL